MPQTPKEIQYEEWVKAAHELVAMINRGTSVSEPWPYKSGKNRWRVIQDANQVIVSYRPGQNTKGKYYSKWVSRKGTPRRFFNTRSIYKTEIEPFLIPEVRDMLIDSLASRITQYFKFQIKDEIDKYDDLEFTFST